MDEGLRVALQPGADLVAVALILRRSLDNVIYMRAPPSTLSGHGADMLLRRV
jgi:hypothetical protein